MELRTESSSNSAGFTASSLPDSYRFPFAAGQPTVDRRSAVLDLPKAMLPQYLPCVLQEPSTNPHGDERILHEIMHLGEAGYVVLRPIPVEIKRIGPSDYQASFLEANIAISGSDSQDAYQALVADILDTFDMLTAEPNLSRTAVGQFQILCNYIGKT